MGSYLRFIRFIFFSTFRQPRGSFIFLFFSLCVCIRAIFTVYLLLKLLRSRRIVMDHLIQFLGLGQKRVVPVVSILEVYVDVEAATSSDS